MFSKFKTKEEKKEARSLKRKERHSKFIDKLSMYDYILSGLYEAESVVEPEDQLKIDSLEVGFNTVSSSTYVSKYFLIKRFPYWINERLIDSIRKNCLEEGVKIDVFLYAEPHQIDWDTDRMKNRQRTWAKFTAEDLDIDEFEFREKREQVERKKNMRASWFYLQKAELEQHRSLCKVFMVVQISGMRGGDGRYIYKMQQSIRKFRNWAASNNVRYRSLNTNLTDWLLAIYPLSLRYIKEVNSRIPKQIMTDDVIARMNSYKQGKIGFSGIPVGMDVNSHLPVIKDVFANVSDADNWLISAKTGAGKSVFVKDKLIWAIGLGIPSMVVDFEGDEYRKIYAYVKAGNPDDAYLIDFGQGNGLYCDPLIIPALTGEEDVDKALKANAVSVAKKMLTIMIKGDSSQQLTTYEESVISSAIRELYDSFLITEDPSTWHNSKKLRLRMIYEIIADYVKSQTFRDDANDNLKHRAAIDIAERLKTFFVEGESRYGTLKETIQIDSLLDAQLILFSFGEKGKTASEIDATTLQLKQHSVANIMNQVSNHCKYVRKTLNLKVIEEYQRYVNVPGSTEIVCNIITGGRKRGDIIMINTNDLNAILGDDRTCETIRQNITTWAVGAILDTDVRERFCSVTKQLDLLPDLEKIASANSERRNSSKKKVKGEQGSELNKRMLEDRYYKAFCVVLDNSDRAIVRVELPKSILDTGLYTTDRVGADTSKKQIAEA